MLIALALVLHPVHNTVLVTRRAPDVHLGGLWEFPGGKVEPGEEPAAAAVREAREETGLDVDILEAWPAIDYVYADRTVTLAPFLCRARADIVTLHGATEWAWANVGHLACYPMPPANTVLLARLHARFA